MRRISRIILIISFLIWNPRANVAQNSQHKDSDCCALVARAIDAVNMLKEGMTRAEVERTFRTEGGLFSRNQTIYVFRDCPYIKVRINFTLDSDYKDFATGSPKDRVESVLKPYLEYSIAD